MEWIELIVHTSTYGSDAVSDLLMEKGASGTMVEDREDIPDPSKPNGIWEIIDPKLIESMPEDVLVHAWFEPGPAFGDLLADLRLRLSGMACDEFGSLQIQTKNVKDEDWAEVWKKFYKPFKAGRSLVVKPTWEPYSAGDGELVIEIDPGMAFGSGMHETTSMCLSLLEDTIRGGESVIDVGTGSGILGIGAALLGADKVLAIDIDPTAVKVAKENVEHNRLSGKITVLEGDLLKETAASCDICVANIIADVICFFAGPLTSHIRSGGTFICSGIILERENDVVQALTKAGYEIIRTERKGEWVAILSRRP